MGSRTVVTVMVIFGVLLIAVNIAGWLVTQNIDNPIVNVMPKDITIYTIASVILAVLMIFFGLRGGKKKKLVRVD